MIDIPTARTYYNRVAALEDALRTLISVAAECDGWEEFPSQAIEDAEKSLNRLDDADGWIRADDVTPPQCHPPYPRYLVIYPNRIDRSVLWTSIQYWVGDKWDVEGVMWWKPLPDQPKI